MKNIFLIIAYFFVCSFCFAQNDSRNKIRVSIFSKNSSSFFVKHEAIDYYKISFDNQKKPSILSFYSQDSKLLPIEEYNLSFEGDQHVLKDMYGINQLQDFLGFSTFNTYSYNNFINNLVLIVSKDSVIYEFEIAKAAHSRLDEVFVAGYKKGDKQLFHEISSLFENFKKQKINPDNYYYLFKGKVNENGSISYVTLIRGKPTNFSKSVKKYLESGIGNWIPAIQGGRYVKSSVDIYIQTDDIKILKVSYLGR